MAEITNEVLKEWRKKAENTWMHSGLGEYTPLEFLELLNYHEARIEALETDVIHARRVADERQEILNYRTKELNYALYGELDDVVYHGDDEKYKRGMIASLRDE